MFSNFVLAIIIVFMTFHTRGFSQQDDGFLDDNRLKCHCKKNHTIKCQTNSTINEFCFQCYTTCGKSVTEAFFFKGSPCMAEKMLNCCPNINKVILDDQSLCDCYSKLPPSVKISGTDKHPVNCTRSNAFLLFKQINLDNENVEFAPKRVWYLCDEAAMFILFALMALITTGLVVTLVQLRRRNAEMRRRLNLIYATQRKHNQDSVKQPLN